MTTNEPTETIASRVFRYLADRRGLDVSARDIAADLDITTQQVTSAVNTLRKARSKAGGQTVDILSPVKGWYRYTGTTEAKSSPIVPLRTKAEVVALLAEPEDALLLNVEGRLYVARPMEVRL